MKGHLIELFLTDLLCRWNLSLHELLAYLFLDVTDLELLATMNDGDRSSLLTSTPSTTRTVGIILDIIGQSEVDDMGQVIHIQTSCSHIRSHEQLCQVLTELLHRQVALLLGEVAMQRLRIIAILNQFVGYLLRLYLRTAENDG